MNEEIFKTKIDNILEVLQYSKLQLENTAFYNIKSLYDLYLENEKEFCYEFCYNFFPANFIDFNIDKIDLSTLCENNKKQILYFLVIKHTELPYRQTHDIDIEKYFYQNFNELEELCLCMGKVYVNLAGNDEYVNNLKTLYGNEYIDNILH